MPPPAAAPTLPSPPTIMATVAMRMVSKPMLKSMIPTLNPTRSAPTKASVARTPHAVPKRCPYSKTDDPPTIGSDTVLFAGFTVSSVPGSGRSV